MLNRVKLSYFQQHIDLEVRLDRGLTAIRGANESGKSTLLRGICYALFGAKAMPDTLDNLVTWGEEVRKLKAEVDFTAADITYNVRRGKSGAEVNYVDAAGVPQKVTGQNEVTAFICRVLKVDALAAPRLMLSNQNEIRGALEAGPKETTALIERLSDFDQIDQVVELIQEKLTLGSTATLEAAIDAARATLTAAREQAVEPDLNGLDEKILWAAGKLQSEQLQLVVREGVLNDTTTALNDGKVAAAKRQAVVDTLTTAGARMGAVVQDLSVLAEIKAPDNAEGRISDLRAAISAEERRSEQQTRKDRIATIDESLQEYRAVAAPAGDVEALRAQVAAGERGAELDEKWNRALPFMGPRPKDGETFQGAIEELDAAIEAYRVRISVNGGEAKTMRNKAALLAQQITDGACGFCGQDFSEVDAVKAKNAALQLQVDALVEDAGRLEHTVSLDTQELAHLQRILAASRPVFAVMAVVGDLVALADGVLPPRLKWTGSPYSEKRMDVDDLRRQISAHEKQQRDYDRAQAKIEALTAERAGLVAGLPDTLPAPADVRALRRQIRELEEAQQAFSKAQTRIEALEEERDRLAAHVAQAETALDDHPAVDLAALQAAVDAARAAVGPARSKVEQAQQALSAANLAKQQAVERYERAKAAVTASAEALEERQQELQDLLFNNALLKAVRQARPIIADKLWMMILSAATRYFTMMRGFESVITKDQEGFRVDGKVVSTASLSGSGLDILGLAIRVALVKTFLPTCPFFVLDEPCAAMDPGRTTNTLGFLSQCGFSQVIVASHDQQSEATSANVVYI